MPDATQEVLPERAIRRFDVFAEVTRLERREKGDAEDVAKGYGIWLAKVVAARRFGKPADGGDRHGAARGTEGHPKFRSLGDELQTDAVFDHDIVERMGERFYREVFAPAIAAAHERGETYEQIRDAIRTEWKPAKPR